MLGSWGQPFWSHDAQAQDPLGIPGMLEGAQPPGEQHGQRDHSDDRGGSSRLTTGIRSIPCAAMVVATARRIWSGWVTTGSFSPSSPTVHISASVVDGGLELRSGHDALESVVRRPTIG